MLIVQKEKTINKMNKTYNIYCDESCHLENDGKRFMVLGVVCCPVDKAREIAVKIRETKSKYDVVEVSKELPIVRICRLFHHHQIQITHKWFINCTDWSMKKLRLLRIVNKSECFLIQKHIY